MNASGKAVSRAARAQWLSELSAAIDEAQWLAWRIGVVEGRNALALELYVEEDPEWAEYLSMLDAAVEVSEAFFEAPDKVSTAYPEVYRQLAQFYRQDPGARVGTRRCTCTRGATIGMTT